MEENLKNWLNEIYMAQKSKNNNNKEEKKND